MATLKDKIRGVPDFPKPGILFYDITTLLQDAASFRQAVEALAAPFVHAGIDLVVGMESRGFIFGAAVAHAIGAGFTPVRKPANCRPRQCAQRTTLSTGSDALEIDDDGVRPGQTVLIVDDLLATGGTAKATLELVTTSAEKWPPSPSSSNSPI